jgi:tetratricopeptide (TPR) repeat protein
VTSDFIRSQTESLLSEAAAALRTADWATVRAKAETVLALDPANADASTLLAAADRVAGGSTQTTAANLQDHATSGTPTQPASFANGRYVVKRFLGEGGKKKVYLAHDTRLDRDVAFALIKTEGLDAGARERITREAQAMGRLGNHPNIVTVYDIGEEDEQPYLVLPVLEGGDVEGLIEKAPEHKLPIEQAIRIGVDACEGLGFAHGKGIVHRDVKPGNTWLTNDGRAMIGDFGLAVAVDRSRLTQAGMMVGTVSYMAPEQAMGGEVTPRADLYALGAMLYEMVCGRPPFVGDESVAIIGQHLNTPPVAPTWHRPDCPPALEALILRLLEKDPQNRPASAAEVRDALRAVQTTDVRPAAEMVSRTEPVPGADPLYRTVFVGREQELKQLQQAYDAAVSGQGGLVMVVGEPGIGKTAVCQQLGTYVSLRGGRTLVGHSYEEGSLSLPYLAFVEAMRTYVLARDPDGLKSDLGSGAADVARIVSEVRDRVSVELRDAGDPEDDRWRLLQSVTAFLRNAASVQPLVIVLEDLHWADRGTLDLLQHVARNLQGARLVVVGTYRDVEVDRAHPLSSALAELRRSGTFLRVPLRGLTVDEVHRMYETLRGYEVPWQQAELVHRQTEGNPLFVQEVLRYLVEEGIVVREQGTYVVRGDATAIPDGLRDVIGRRLSHLDEKTNTVLSIASVMGRDFRLDVLQRVAALPEDELYGALEQASEHAIVEQLAVPSGVTFRFTHAMFRTLLYEEIFAPRRIRLHQQVGRALEYTYARRLEEHAAELAEHFSQSTEAADLEKAVHCGELAAQRAMGVFAYGEAVRHLEQALRAQEVLDPDNARKTCELFLELGDALLPAGQGLQAMDAAENAYQAAVSLGNEPQAWRACRIGLDGGFLFEPGIISGRWGRWLDRAEKYTHVSTAARIRFLRAKFVQLNQSGKRTDARPMIEEAMELARDLGDSEAEYSIAWSLLNFYNVPGYEDEQLRLAEEFYDRPRAGVGALNLAQMLVLLASTFFSFGDRARAERLKTELEVLAEQTRYSQVTAHVLHARIMAALIDGRLSDVLDLASELEAHFSGTFGNAASVWLTHRMNLYRLAVWLGSSEEIELPAGRDFGTAARALILLQHGRDAEAREALSQVLQSSRDPRFLGGDCSRLEAAVLLKDKGMVEELTAILLPARHRVDGVWSPISVGRLLGNGSVILGRPEEARAYYDEALEVCNNLRFRPEIALIRLDLAELLLEHYPEERDAAIEHLDFAISEFRGMKMQPSLERALRHRGLLRA